MGAVQKIVPRFSNEGGGFPLSPTRMGDGSLDAFLKNRNPTNNTTYTPLPIPESSRLKPVENPRNPKPNDAGKQRQPTPIPEIPIPRPLPKTPKPYTPPETLPLPTLDLSLIQALSDIARNGANIAYELGGENGFNDRFVEIQNVLCDVRDAIQSIPDFFKDNWPDTEKLGSVFDGLSSLTDMADTLIQSQNALVDIFKSIDSLAALMPNVELVNSVNILKKESLEFDQTPIPLTLIDGASASWSSPRQAAHLNNASREITARETNNEKYDDSDFDFMDLIMPTLPFKGVWSDMETIMTKFGGSEMSTNPFNFNFDVFGNLTETKHSL